MLAFQRFSRLHHILKHAGRDSVVDHRRLYQLQYFAEKDSDDHKEEPTFPSLESYIFCAEVLEGDDVVGSWSGKLTHKYDGNDFLPLEWSTPVGFFDALYDERLPDYQSHILDLKLQISVTRSSDLATLILFDSCNAGGIEAVEFETNEDEIDRDEAQKQPAIISFSAGCPPDNEVVFGNSCHLQYYHYNQFTMEPRLKFNPVSCKADIDLGFCHDSYLQIDSLHTTHLRKYLFLTRWPSSIGQKANGGSHHD